MGLQSKGTTIKFTMLSQRPYSFCLPDLNVLDIHNCILISITKNILLKQEVFLNRRLSKPFSLPKFENQHVRLTILFRGDNLGPYLESFLKLLK